MSRRGASTRHRAAQPGSAAARGVVPSSTGDRRGMGTSARTRSDAQRNRAVGARTDFRCMEDQQPIEPTFLVIQCAAERLEPGERAIERAFLFAGSADRVRTGWRANDPPATRAARRDRMASDWRNAWCSIRSRRDSGDCPTRVARSQAGRYSGKGSLASADPRRPKNQAPHQERGTRDRTRNKERGNDERRSDTRRIPEAQQPFGATRDELRIEQPRPTSWEHVVPARPDRTIGFLTHPR